MKLAYITDFDLLNPAERNNHHPKAVGHRGRCFYAAQSIGKQGIDIQYLSSSVRPSNLISKLKRRYYRYCFQQTYHAWATPSVNRAHAAQICNLAAAKPDVFMAPEVKLLAYVDSKVPMVLWTDALYTSLLEAYGDFSHLCPETVKHLTTMDRLALEKCQLAVFPSVWAAETAINTFKIHPSKVKVVPFGANVECDRTSSDIHTIVNARPRDVCRLVFIGADWVRKGGAIVLNAAKCLQQLGLNVELTIIGCKPPTTEHPLPAFVKAAGFINKSRPEGLAKFNQLLASAHFLIVPSKAETFGNVFCEANSFGVPSLSTCSGGITTIIQDGVNGKTFPLDASPKSYASYIQTIFQNYSTYQELALSSFLEYQQKFDWSASGKAMADLLSELK